LRKLRLVSTADAEGARAHVLAAELLEQVLQLVGRGQQDQTLQQARARLAVGNLQLLAVGLFVDAVEEELARVLVLELVQLQHLVGTLEVLLLVVVEHAIVGDGAGAGCVGGVVLEAGAVLDRLERLFLVLLVALDGAGVVVAIALALLLLVAAAALPVVLGHVGGEWHRSVVGSAKFRQQRSHQI
jgi:hypothetical protein